MTIKIRLTKRNFKDSLHLKLNPKHRLIRILFDVFWVDFLVFIYVMLLTTGSVLHLEFNNNP